MQLPETNCARARESLSAQLDGELPELDLGRLEIHLLVCPECSAWAEDVREMTRRLREAELVVPTEGLVRVRHSRRWTVSASVALASAAAVVATMFVAPGQQARNRLSGPRFAGATGQHTMVPRLSRLEDGMYATSSDAPLQVSLRVV